MYGIYGNIGLSTDTRCPKRISTRLAITNSYDKSWESYRNDAQYVITHKDVPRDFKTALSTVSLANRGSNQYLIVNRYNLIKIDASLIYDSTTDKEQTVIVKLMGIDGFIYNEQSFIVGGANNPDFVTLKSRILDYSFEGFYFINDEIYLTVEPQLFDCVIKEEEVQDIEGGYQLIGAAGSLDTEFKAVPYYDPTFNNGAGGDRDTDFSGDVYRYMVDGHYDILRFTPTGVDGIATPTDEVKSKYDFEHSYYMGFGKDNITGDIIYLMSDALDYTQYNTYNHFIHGMKEVPRPFAGIEWTTYDIDGTATPHIADTLTGVNFSIARKSFVKVYESNVIGINERLNKHLLTHYLLNKQLAVKDGFTRDSFPDPVKRFYDASDATNREVFAYGSATAKYEEDGIHLIYYFAKDLAGYPITGEFIGRLTAKDPCGNFATIYILLCIDVKSGASSIKIRDGFNGAIASTEIPSVL